MKLSHSSATTDSTIPLAIDAPRTELNTPAGRINLYTAGPEQAQGPAGGPQRGQEPTLLLIHSINAAGSAYEVRPVFEHYRSTRRVVAMDLPGFGFSERSDRQYDIALYQQSIDAVAAHLAADTGQPIGALALSLSCEFLARAAREDHKRDKPHLARLAFVTPTGFRKSDARMTGPDGASREIGWLSRFVQLGAVGKPLYRLLTRPGTIRYFLKRTWGSASYDDGLARYDARIARQDGAHYAPLAFISGRLFSRDIRRVYESLTLPVFVGHGTRGDFKDFRGARWIEARDNWTRVAFATGAFPHFEQQDAFFTELDRFFGAP